MQNYGPLHPILANLCTSSTVYAEWLCLRMCTESFSMAAVTAPLTPNYNRTYWHYIRLSFHADSLSTKVFAKAKIDYFDGKFSLELTIP